MTFGGVALAFCGPANGLDVRVDEDPRPPQTEFVVPDLSQYTVAAIRGRVPKPTAGVVRVTAAADEPLLTEAIRRERGDDLRARQRSEELEAIVVASGVVTLGGVVEKVADATIAKRGEKAVTLRRPIVVGAGAVLVIDGRETPVVHLSSNRGSFVVNGGTLFVIEAEVVAWDEPRGEPTAFATKSAFRPFIASMIRSETFLAGSRFRNLGYAAPTAYGVSLSTQPERAHGEPTDASPSGVLVGNVFEDLYYGFYSFEARDVAIVDNVYRRCVVYGIDPHDRTTRLLIARNQTTGTLERHGIIGSRGVSDSLIVDNESFGNAGSGIMLDRQCRGVVVANNRVYDNGQGIAVYESPDNLIVDNVIAANESSGIRVRNSVDVVAARNTIVGNGDYAFDISAKRLADHDRRAERGDTYETAVRVSVYATRVAANRGFAKAAGLGRLRVAGVATAVELDAVSTRLGGFAVSRRYTGRDREFGSELKPARDQLARLFATDTPLVVRGSGAP